MVARVLHAYNIAGKTVLLKRLERRILSNFALSSSFIEINAFHIDLFSARFTHSCLVYAVNRSVQVDLLRLKKISTKLGVDIYNRLKSKSLPYSGHPMVKVWSLVLLYKSTLSFVEIFFSLKRPTCALQFTIYIYIYIYSPTPVGLSSLAKK